MAYMIRLGICGLLLGCMIGAMALVVEKAYSLETIQYDELTCDELVHSYHFNNAVLSDIVDYYDGCVDFADSPASVGSNDMLSCKFIQEHGTFVEGIVNDLADVYNIKCATE